MWEDFSVMQVFWDLTFLHVSQSHKRTWSLSEIRVESLLWSVQMEKQYNKGLGMGGGKGDGGG